MVKYLTLIGERKRSPKIIISIKRRFGNGSHFDFGSHFGLFFSSILFRYVNKYILSWFSHNLLVNWSYFNNYNVFIRFFWQGRRPFWKRRPSWKNIFGPISRYVYKVENYNWAKFHAFHQNWTMVSPLCSTISMFCYLKIINTILKIDICVL